MRVPWTLGGFVLLLFVSLSLYPDKSNSAIIVKSKVPAELSDVAIPLNQKENITMDVFEEAVEDYVDLSNAFHTPEQSDTLREKRTLTVFRRIANRTRSGIKTLRTLFSGGGGSSESSGSSTGRNFRTFFSNLLNRILTFLTKLWDRITGIFRSGGSDGGSGSSSLLNRIRTGAAGLVNRFSGSGSGGGGFLSNLLSPKTTAAPDYSDSISESDPSTEAPPPLLSSTLIIENEEIKAKEEEGKDEKEREEKVESGYAYSGNVALDPVSQYVDTAAESSNVYRVGHFIPFPMDSNPAFHLPGVSSFSYDPSYSSPWTHSISRRQSENYPTTRHLFSSYY